MIEELNEIHKALIFVLGGLEDLVEKGLITRTGHSAALTESGKELYGELNVEGFVLHPETLKALADIIRGMPRYAKRKQVP